MNTPNALPVRIRKTFEDAVLDVTLQTHANFRYTISSPINHDIELTTNEQLERFESVVTSTISAMPETFMVMKRFVDGDNLAVKVRAVGYSASNEVVLGHNAKGDKVEQFITSTINQVRSFFGDEPADAIQSILAKANETRKQNEIMQTLAPTFGSAVASRMAELLKQVLAEEEAKGVSPEDSSVIPGVAIGLLGNDYANTNKPADDESAGDGEAPEYESPLSVYFQDDAPTDDAPAPITKTSKSRTKKVL